MCSWQTTELQASKLLGYHSPKIYRLSNNILNASAIIVSLKSQIAVRKISLLPRKYLYFRQETNSWGSSLSKGVFTETLSTEVTDHIGAKDQDSSNINTIYQDI